MKRSTNLRQARLRRLPRELRKMLKRRVPLAPC